MRERRTYSATKKGHVRLDMGLYDASLLRDEVALEVAIGDLESNLAKAPSVGGIVEDLSSVPHLLEFALSAVGDPASHRLRDSILTACPSDATSFMTSLSGRLLIQFSQYFEFLPYMTPSDRPSDIREKFHSVRHATQVLEVLAEHSFRAPIELERSSSSKTTRKTAKKQSKRPTIKAPLDSKVFNDLEIPVPSNQEEAFAIVANLIESQTQILHYYLQLFRYPHLRETIKHAYVGNADSVQNTPASNDTPSRTAEQGHVATEETASAHLFVLPMKAALYFDSAEGFGQWRIIISTAADADLRRMRKKSSELFSITLKKIKELSMGHFSADNKKQLTQGADIPIYEAKMTGDSRLVYQIDCVPEFESDGWRQVIKIFGIYNHAEINRRLWDRMGNQLGRMGKDYQARCMTQSGEHVLPKSWPTPVEIEFSTTSYTLPDSHNNELEKVHEMLVLEKYVAFSQTLLNSILADQDVMHVFQVSPQEKEIIEYSQSCYVIGRSGTGKTTTMLFKMLGIERSWKACEGALTKPRQVFVTQSRVLAEKVQEFFAKLYASLLTADTSSEALEAMAATTKTWQAQGLVDRDEEVDFQEDLPRRYSELTDEHFPMFLTFDQLCRLLEADLPHSVSTLQPVESPFEAYIETSAGVATNPTSNDYMQQQRDSFVSYGVFLDSYWAHFPQPLIKNLDPALVFSEIIGVIKGSEQSIHSKHGYLDRDSYLNISSRTQATFANQRNLIYDLFVAYLRQKRRRGEYDAADRTHCILKMFQSCGVPGKQLDFLYVDEAQDNLLIDALVLRSLSNNAHTGLFWAGDTAQTISIGSAFRFNDLKAFLYRVELDRKSRVAAHPHPHTFQLAVNYRSHAGIVNCAHSIIELITMFWPHAIDNLAPERGIIEGMKPIFFSGWDDGSVRYEQFLFGDSAGQLEFGAQQCILVRDDAARKRLRTQVGDIGLIFTLYESKGLEFDDVLIYDFFADSTVELSHWRVILNALSAQGPITLKAPQFDDTRHSGVCRDLKFLYVAITRARKNLWIADSSDKCEPMRLFWSATGHVQSCTPDSDLPRLATSSTPEQWAKSALELFNHRRYSQAMHCYERAKLFRERAVAEAYYLREQARTSQTNSGRSVSRAITYVEAAEAFWKAGHEATIEKRSYFRISAECYEEGGNLAQAAQAYLLADEFGMSAKIYRNAGLFDDALAVVQCHGQFMDQQVVRTIRDVLRLEYLRKRNLKQARTLFDSDDDALEYMEDRGLDIARATLLEQLGRFTDAAEAHLAEGRTMEAISLLMQDHDNPYAAERASSCLLEGLQRRLSFGINPSSEAARADTVLQKLRDMLTSGDMEMARLDDKICDSLHMFRAIMSNDVSTLLKLSEQFRQWHKDSAAALRCLDHAFSSMPKLQVASLQEIAQSLHHFAIYVELLRAFASSVDLCNEEGIQSLFAFQVTSEDFFLIPTGTFLHPRVGNRSRGVRQSEQGFLVLKHDLNRILRHALQERLWTKIREENELCYRACALQICLPFFAFGRCGRSECLHDHIAAEEYSIVSYNLRTRVHLQQILIYNSVHTIEGRGEQRRQHRYWLRQLHEVLNPPSFKMGNIYSLRPSTIPEYRTAIQVVKTWILDWLYHDLHPCDAYGDLQRTFLTALMRTILLGSMLDSVGMRQHLPQIPSVSTYRPERLLRGREGLEEYIVHDLERYVYNEHPASLESGILFVNHVLVARLSVDIVVLCEFLDSLCGLLVVASRLQGTGTLHDITMPRSWLLRVLPHVHNLKDKSTKLIPLYMAPMADLLEQIYTSNAEHLLFDKSDISRQHWHVRNVFLARICRNLCLLGYNSRYGWLRDKIHCTITSLRRPGRDFNRMYQHYVDAPNWAALAREVREYSTSKSPFDEMVQLYDGKMGQPGSQMRIRRIIYNDVNEIPVLLTSSADAMPQSDLTLNRDARPFVPQRPRTPHMDDSPALVDGPTEYEDEDDLQGMDEDVDAAPPVINLNDESLAFEAPDAAAAQRVKMKLDAARVIAEAYRRYTRRKTVTLPTKPDAIIHLRFIDAYRAKYKWDMTLQEPHKRYRLLLLVPLPYGMTYLELARSHLYDAKNRLKKRLKDAKHLELEEISSRITECNGQFKETLRLIKALEPGAILHERRDWQELRARLREVEELAGNLPSSVTADWEVYLKTAAAGILEPKLRPTKKPKPELNMADDMVDYADIA